MAAEIPAAEAVPAVEGAEAVQTAGGEGLGGVAAAIDNMAVAMEAAEGAVPEEIRPIDSVSQVGSQAAPSQALGSQAFGPQAVVPAQAHAVLASHQVVRQQLAEQVVEVLGAAMRIQPQIILMQKEEILQHALSFQRAPEVFRQQYNTRECYSWALAGYNLVTQSFFRDGVKTEETMHEVCAGCLVWVVRRLEWGLRLKISFSHGNFK